MVSYDYDRENAEKTYEYMKYKRAQYTLGKTLLIINILIYTGTACGVAAAMYARPIQRNLEKYSALFRKPWMRLPIYSFAFTCAFYGGIQLPGRIFPKFTPRLNDGVSHAVYTSSQDLVARFRMFEHIEDVDTKGDIAGYLGQYTSKPFSRVELVDRAMTVALKNMDVGKLFKVKQNGRDRDPMFWSFGKIHGLENIAFADPEEIRATNGNPVKIQRIIN